MKLIHEWKTQSGFKVTATCELVLKETCFADGYNVEVDVCKQMFDISVTGKGSVGNYINRESQEMGGTIYPATCGMLVISQENLDTIDIMIGKIESHPEWIKKVAQDEKNMKESAEYEQHYASVNKAMNF